MPKSTQSQTFKCHQQADGGFTVITSESWNKENSDLMPNQGKLSQAIALERLQALRMVELEHVIWSKAFSLIERYYRPLENNASGHCSSNDSVGVTTVTTKSQSRRKRHNNKCAPMCKIAVIGNADDFQSHFTFSTIRLPRKRVQGLLREYNSQYTAKISESGISKHFNVFHHNHIDWQQIFAPIMLDIQHNNNSNSSSSSNNNNNQFSSKGLAFDSLFDYEDAIAFTANLLSIAQQHANLFDGLRLREEECESGKSLSANYAPCDGEKNCSGDLLEFRQLISLVEKLIMQKKSKIEQWKKMKVDTSATGGDCHNNYDHCDSYGKSNPLLIYRWFKSSSSSASPQLPVYDEINDRLENIAKEINAWEELVDVVEISTK